MKTMALILLSCGVLAGVAACGQKGPLYLPDKAGDVVTRPPEKQKEAPPETDPAKSSSQDR
jgi:predicted small lipoprotein YifL